MRTSANKKVEVASGVFLQGRELEDYCQKRGKCPLCAKTRVKKRVVRVFGSNSWEPITLQLQPSMQRRFAKKTDTVSSSLPGVYLVYKGFCLSEGCFTLEQAKRLAEGEATQKRTPIRTALLKQRSLNSFRKLRRKAKKKAASSEGEAKHEEGEKIVHPMRSEDDESIYLSMSETEPTHVPPDGMIIDADPNATSSSGALQQANERLPMDTNPIVYPPKDLRHQFLYQWLDENENDDSDNDAPNTTSIHPPLPVRDLLKETANVVTTKGIRTIDLTGIRLRLSEVHALAQGLSMAQSTVESLILKDCGLDDSRMEILGPSLCEGLSRLHLGENKLQTEGVDALCVFLETSKTLKVLDVSRNHIESMGGVAIFNAFRRNPNTVIQQIDLSYNLLKELDQGALSASSAAVTISPSSKRQASKGTTNTTAPGQYHFANFGGAVFGVHGFLSKNNTLLELNLTGNRMRCRGIEALFGGLKAAGPKSKLESIGLGFNRIGDQGAKAIGDGLTVNRSLRLLELNDNNIHNEGGMALLAALDHNTTLQDITGLWSNQIDRRFIIVSIRRLLLSTTRSSIHLSDTRDATLSEHSDGEEDDSFANVQPKKDTVASLEQSCQENVSDLSEENDESSSSYEKLLREDYPKDYKDEMADGMMETNQEVSQNLSDSLTVFHAAPFAGTSDVQTIPLFDAQTELRVISEAVGVAMAKGVYIQVVDETPTVDRFRNVLVRRESSVLHYTSMGLDETTILLEDESGMPKELPLEGLTDLVLAAQTSLRLVVVCSPQATTIGQAFVNARVPHVVCCHRDVKFQDPIATLFLQSFYKSAAKANSLTNAFQAAVKDVLSSPLSKNLGQVTKRFRLLSSSSSYDDAKSVCFHPTLRRNGISTSHGADCKLPALPEHFLGREKEIAKILESLQRSDCVVVHGAPNCGKSSLVAASVGHVMKRKGAFSLHASFWLPAPESIETDSLYGDLSHCYEMVLSASSENSWEELLEYRDRLEVELEDTLPSLFVMDCRTSRAEGSRESLRKFVEFLLIHSNESKVILLSNTKETWVSQSLTVEVGPLDLRSSALLFGQSCKHIQEHECSVARSANEFADLVDPPFSQVRSNTAVTSVRKRNIFECLGEGLPSRVIDSAQSMSIRELEDLIKIALQPDICVESTNELESEVRRWSTFRREALQDKNYQRAKELESTLEELERMRDQFPSLNDLKAREQKMKADLSDAVANRRYDIANGLKKDLLVLKKKIMKERRPSTTRYLDNPKDMLMDLKAQVDSIVADTKNESIEYDLSPMSNDAMSFLVDCDGHDCEFLIFSGIPTDQSPRKPMCSKPKKRGVVCWTNEACRIEDSSDGRTLLEMNGEKVTKAIAKLQASETPHGPVPCLLGKSLLLGSDSSFLFSATETGAVILTVGPFDNPTSYVDTFFERDHYFQQFTKTMLKSCYRSSMAVAKESNLDVLSIAPLTARTKGGRVYEELLKVGLCTIVEEAKFSKLQQIRITGKTSEEAFRLVEIMQSIGYTIVQI